MMPRVSRIINRLHVLRLSRLGPNSCHYSEVIKYLARSNLCKLPKIETNAIGNRNFFSRWFGALDKAIPGLGKVVKQNANVGVAAGCAASGARVLRTFFA